MPTDQSKLVICPLCNRYFKGLLQHLPRVHKMSLPDFRLAYPDAQVEDPAQTAKRKLKGGYRYVIPVDPLGDLMQSLLEEYKIMVLYEKMTLNEYLMRRQAFFDLRARRGEGKLNVTGWGILHARLRKATKGEVRLVSKEELEKIEEAAPPVRKFYKPRKHDLENE